MKALAIIGIIVLFLIVGCGGLMIVGFQKAMEFTEGSVLVIVSDPSDESKSSGYFIMPEQSSIVYTSPVSEEVIEVDDSIIQVLLSNLDDESISWELVDDDSGISVVVSDRINGRTLHCELSSCHPKIIALLDSLAIHSGYDYK